MAKISEMITLGLGTPSTIGSFITVGFDLSVTPPAAGGGPQALTGESGYSAGMPSVQFPPIGGMANVGSR